MQIDPIPLHNQSNLLKDYRNNQPEIMKYFDYHPTHDFYKRVRDLQLRTFQRESLAEALSILNKQWNAPLATLDNIKRLKQNNSVVVIGGQQAGLLTGPLYTINKIISIIQLARKREVELGIPVIPVFWIAGEDHDFEEINHVYLPEQGKMKKYKVSQPLNGKESVSDIQMDKQTVIQWLEEVFQQLEETNYTKELHRAIHQCLNQSKSYTDFFAKLIFLLFKDEGLVLIDSHHSIIRSLESNYFCQLIENQEEISEAVYHALQELEKSGYSVSLDADRNNAHLFYHVNQERVLLKRSNTGHLVGKQNEVILTKEELLHAAKHHPQLLSNNVVTRPIMQELLFPTLAFIGGPGEIAYWASLKQAFHAVNVKMPPVIPRLSFTFVESNVQRALANFQLDGARVVEEGVEEYRNEWLATKTKPPIQVLTEELKNTIQQAHEPVQAIAKEIRADMGALASKNLQYLLREVDYIEKRLQQGLEEKYDIELAKLDLIQQALQPNGGLQERTWNPIHFINRYGLDFIRPILKHDLSFDMEHYFVYV